MLVCHCRRVNDREIRQCVRDGCTSARTVSRICGAGSGCGGCMPLVKALVKDELTQMASEVVAEAPRRYLALISGLQPTGVAADLQAAGLQSAGLQSA